MEKCRLVEMRHGKAQQLEFNILSSSNPTWCLVLIVIAIMKDDDEKSKSYERERVIELEESFQEILEHATLILSSQAK